MSQPPPQPSQPPGQPPSGPPSGQQTSPSTGGFGPPSGGGFGPPTPPPAPAPVPSSEPPSGPPTPRSAPPIPPGGRPGDPGYGYPQAPSSPTPPPTGGFGSAAPPGSYGPVPTPPPTPAPGPYGWGSQPGVPGVPPPARRRSHTAIVVAIAAVLGLVLAGGVVMVLTDDDGGGRSDTADGGDGPGGRGGADRVIDASLAWATESPEVTQEEIIQGARGLWFTGDTVVRMIDDSITAYDLRGGQEVWSLPVEVTEGECNASRTADRDRIALLQGRDCEVLTVVDIAAGEEIMSVPLGIDYPPGEWDYPVIMGDTVAVDLGIYGAGYSIGSQEQIWESDSNQECPEGAYAVFDDMVVSQTVCGFGLAAEGGSIRATTEDGEELWEWSYGPEYEGKEFSVSSVISVEPLVVTAWVGESGDAANERIFLIDEDHRSIRHELDYDGDRYQSPCEVNTFVECPYAVVHDGHLYLGTRAESGSRGAIVSFDLETGTAIYELDSLNGAPTLPFGVRDGEILAYEAPPFDEDSWEPTGAGQVVGIDPATERARPVMTLDDSAADREHTLADGLDWQERRLAWHEDTFVFLNESFQHGDTENPPAMLVYH